MSPDDPVVQWLFAGRGTFVEAPDAAPRSPQVSLRVDERSANLQGAVLDGQALVLSGAFLSARALDTDALGSALSARSGSLTAEIWVEDSTVVDDAVIFGCQSGGFALSQIGTDLNATIHTTKGELALVGAGVSFNKPHHVVLTYTSATGTAQLYVNGAKVGSGELSVDVGMGAAPVVWPLNTAEDRNFIQLGSSSPWTGRIRAAAVFDRPLNEREVVERFRRGAP